MQSSPDGADARSGAHPLGSRGAAVLDATFLVLCFLPYVCLPVGDSTNVPLTGLIWTLWLPRIIRHRRVALAAALLALTPVLTGYLGLLAGKPVENPVALLTWVLYLAPLPVCAVIVAERARLAARVLGFCLMASSVFALVQHQLILRGRLVFEGMYEAPGYAAVNSDLVLTYVKRPFGQFPEPSFMAGSLALAAGAYILVRRLSSARMTAYDYGLIGMILVVLVLSRSGSTVVAGLAVLGMLLAPAARNLRWPVVMSVVALGGAYIALSVLDQRSSSSDYSWGDRVVSIAAAARYVLADPVAILFGVGRGRSAHLFATGEISITSYDVGGVIYDVYSVLGRAALESGLIFGAALLVVGVVVQVRAHRTTKVHYSSLVGIFAGVLWVVVAGLTISYDSAAMIWLSLGVALGAVVRQSMVAAEPVSSGRRDLASSATT